VGPVSLLFVGSGLGLAPTLHPYIADAFFFVGFALLLVKFWIWGGAKLPTVRKTAVLLAGVTVAFILLFVGSCFLSRYLGTPKRAVGESAARQGFLSPTASLPPAATLHAAVPTVSPGQVVEFNTSKRQMLADQREVKRLFLQYRAAHPGGADEAAELRWLNIQLARKGIPFAVFAVSTASRPGRPPAESQPPQGTGIIGARGETTLDHVVVSGFPTGIDLRPSERADVKNSEVRRDHAQRPKEKQRSPSAAKEQMP
jgi:hypothetical protein